MKSLTELRDGLANVVRLNTTAGIYTYAEVEARGNFPAVVIEPHSADYNVSMARGTDSWDFNIFVLVRGADLPTAQRELDSFVTGSGDNSIRRAIFENQDLGLGDDVTGAHVYLMRGYGGAFEWAGTEHLGAILKARVYVSN